MTGRRAARPIPAELLCAPAIRLDDPQGNGTGPILETSTPNPLTYESGTPSWVILPWTVGGHLFHEVFDHTSCLRLIEQVAAADGLDTIGPVTFSNLSRWRGRPGDGLDAADAAAPRRDAGGTDRTAVTPAHRAARRPRHERAAGGLALERPIYAERILAPLPSHVSRQTGDGYITSSTSSIGRVRHVVQMSTWA